jgi:hypothetical protein
MTKGNHKHGHSPEGRPTRTYQSWASMKGRCLNPRNPKYSIYGGRGIKVWDQWLDFNRFLEDMGERPNGMSLERVDVDGHYVPWNCMWATPKRQANNKRSNRILTHNGESLTSSQWADRLGLSYATLRMRLHRGWSVERALTEKP